MLNNLQLLSQLKSDDRKEKYQMGSVGVSE